MPKDLSEEANNFLKVIIAVINLSASFGKRSNETTWI
jgi:hypothetical protein